MVTEVGRGDMPAWLFEAFNELGIHETPGPQATARVLEYHAVTKLKATSDEIPWCSSFVNWCLKRVGIEPTYSAAAISWLDWGFAMPEPRQGAIIILCRAKDPTKGHVGFYLETQGDNVLVLGGNQNNEVCKQWFPKAKVKSYRWPWPLDESDQCR